MSDVRMSDLDKAILKQNENLKSEISKSEINKSQIRDFKMSDVRMSDLVKIFENRAAILNQRSANQR